MPIIRTPDERFENLPDFPYEPHYIEIKGLRVHFIDEGEGNIILCLHGEPSWSYLYRKMIPPLVKAGYRVIAPDFIGFGRSDKYTERSEYSFELHYDTIENLVSSLDLANITLVCQDWGGMIGLTVAAMNPDRFARLVIMNTFLPTGEEQLSEGFLAWRAFAERTPDLIASMVVRGATISGRSLPPEVLAAYDAPFPDKRYKAGMQIFPLLVPITPDMQGATEMKEARKRLADWNKPALVMFSDSDPVMVGYDRFFRELIPTAKEQPQITIEQAAHFLQEDKGEEIAQYIIEFLKRAQETSD
ncbi:MAG: haloalkane dehalogenase [Candidatus Thorarchaeota archaeon]|jgi:haloalkane dehalogenase